MKRISGRYGNDRGHWVGDGFPVRSLFSYNQAGDQLSPFLLLDYGGPYNFEPSTSRRGVGQHPHRGFETVTIVFDGEVEHRDSTGQGGVIGPGDVQWMTAGSGILHEEYHSTGFSRSGGPFRMVQLWVNLPAKDKMTDPGYQSILDAQIPTVDLAGGAGSARIIAGELDGLRGPARTFSDINVWDVRLKGGTETTLDLPDGHSAIIVALAGHVTVNGDQPLGAAEGVQFDRDGAGAQVRADGDSHLLVLTGEPLDEPIVGYGPFVMNTEDQIRQAITDFNSGKFGQIAH